jgi:large subunit ribosomal protein L25
MTKIGSIVVEVEPREETGKGPGRRLRARGLVPGIVYGLDRSPFMVAVDPRKIEDVLLLSSGVNTIFTLSLAGQQRRRETMIKELQRDPITSRPTHVDFVRIDADKAVHVGVPIRLLGIPTGVKNESGILDFVQREVQVECLPGMIPEHLTVDVSELHINQHVAVKDLAAVEGVKVLGDPEQIVAVVKVPKAEEVAVPVAVEAAATPAEPELVKKGKEPAGEEKPGDDRKS